MAVAKQQRPQTAEEKRIAHRIKMAKQHPHPVDRSGDYHERIAELARELGWDVCDAVDEWADRAASRQYDAGMTRERAEELAFDELRERLLRCA